MTTRGSRVEDPNNFPLLMADSQTAVNTFGLSGGRFLNSPKHKFLFFAKFFRPDAAGGSDWIRGISFAIKTIDRPRISFDTQTVSQYNRKRVIQSQHSFEPLTLKFHDTVDESLNRMFLEYYSYYYGDPTLHSGSQSVYDVVKPQQFRAGSWGFRPPLDESDPGYFFSHVKVYQLYQGRVATFELVNPKITSFNPDEFNYEEMRIVNEIVMQISFEGITYSLDEILTPELAEEMGLDYARYFELEDDIPLDAAPGIAGEANFPIFSTADRVDQILREEATNLILTGRTRDIGAIAGQLVRTYDPIRGVAVGNVGAGALGGLLSGGVRGARRTIGAQLRASLRGRPGGLF